jgi:hypothetical protein
MRLRQSWVDTAKEMHEEASEWRWLEELRALTQRAAQRFNFPAHRLKLRRFLHLDAFSSIITAIRRWFDTISCTFRFLSSFFNSLFTLSASTWLGIFQLAMLHAILAFAMMRKAPVIVRVAQPVVSRNTSSPQQLPPPSHVRRRSIPWWQARSDPAEFPIASSAASSREHRAQPQTAAEKLLRRMRQEAEEKQSGSSEHHSAAEHPHQAESAPPHRLTIPQHLSASSHIVTPLMPTSPRLSSPRTAVPGGPAVFFSSHTRPSPLVATRSQPSTSSSAATASSAAEAPAEDRDPSPEPPGEQYDEVAPRI